MRFNHPLLWITLLAVLLRFYDLSGESLWLDETTTSLRISWQYSDLASDYTQGPLYLVLTKALCSVVGETEFTLRLLSVLCGAATVLLMYPLGNALLGAPAGALAALLMAINPFAVHYSQDARPYSLFILSAVAAFYLLTRLVMRFKFSDAILFILSVTACLYTHPFAVFLLPALAVAYILLKSAQGKVERLDVWRIAGIFAAIAVLFLPQILRFGGLFLQKVESSNVATWIEYPRLLHLYWTFRNYFMLHLLAWFALAVIVFGVVQLWHVTRRERLIALTLCWWGFCTAIVPWAVSIFITPIYVIRYTAPALAGVLLLLTFGLLRMRRPLRIPAIVIIVLLSAVSFRYYYVGVDKDPWRQTVTLLRERKQPDEAIVLYPRYLNDPFRFYYPPSDSQAVISLPVQDTLATHLPDLHSFWFVNAYGIEYPRETERLLREIHRNYSPTEVIRMNDRIRRNPYTFYLASITLTRFVANSSAESAP